MRTRRWERTGRMRNGVVLKTDAVCILVLHIKRGVGKDHFVHGISKVF